MSLRALLTEGLIRDEGEKFFPYEDTVGKITIGVGRNLSDKGISKAESNLLLQNDIDDAVLDARSLIRNFDDLSDTRKYVMCNMAFNLGRTRLSMFRATLAAVNEGRYEDAARHMLKSNWASQVPKRAMRLAEQMREG